MNKKREYNGAGIYGLYNVVENKIYIGSSKHIHNRFMQHRHNFRNPDAKLLMYKEPINHFTFMVLHKLPDDEFEKYGNIYEMLYIYSAREQNISVYNKVDVHDDLSRLFCYLLDVRDNLYNTIRSTTGYKLNWITCMKPDTRLRYWHHMRKHLDCLEKG